MHHCLPSFTIATPCPSRGNVTLLITFSAAATKRRPRIVGVRTLETIRVPIEDKTVGVTREGVCEGGVVGGRGGVSRETVRRVIKIVGAVAGGEYEALEGVVKAEMVKQLD